MKILFTWLGIMAFTCGSNLYAGDKNTTHENSQFKLLKSLVGNWQGYKEGGKNQPVKLSYELSSAGNAVVERIFQGSPQEMVTVYHKDGKKLLMTHYCSLGNQPRMQSGASSDKNKIDFKFKDITNLASKTDPHMHDMSLSLQGDNKLQQKWTMHAGGSAKETAVFHFTRQ